MLKYITEILKTTQKKVFESLSDKIDKDFILRLTTTHDWFLKQAESLKKILPLLGNDYLEKLPDVAKEYYDLALQLRRIPTDVEFQIDLKAKNLISNLS